MTCPVSATSRLTDGAKQSPVILYKLVANPIELQKMVKDGIYVLGGQYAITLRWLRPSLAQGSVEYGDLATRILRRLKTTSRLLNAVVYGTPEEKASIFSVIHKNSAVREKTTLPTTPGHINGLQLLFSYL